MVTSTNNNKKAICLLANVCLFCELNIYQCVIVINTNR